MKCCFKNPKTLVIRVPSEASIQETIDAIHHHPWYPRSVTDDLSSFGLFLRQWPSNQKKKKYLNIESLSFFFFNF